MALVLRAVLSMSEVVLATSMCFGAMSGLFCRIVVACCVVVVEEEER